MRWTAFLTLFGLVSLAAAEPISGKKKAVKYLAPTWRGSTGFFEIYGADTLRRGEFSLALQATRFNRAPGAIRVTVFPLSLTWGLHDRIEAFLSWEAHKRVRARGIQTRKVLSRNDLAPVRLINSQVSYYNDMPFLDVTRGSGSGHLWAGGKWSVLSERRGDPLGLSIQPIVSLHLSDGLERMLNGLTPGTSEAGIDLIVSRGLVGGRWAFNAGHVWAPDKAMWDRQNRFNYGVGFEWPSQAASARFITEILGSGFYGPSDTGLANPQWPLDLNLGLRASTRSWLSLAIAYRLNLRHAETATPSLPTSEPHGWMAQVVFQRKVNRPPSIQCTPERASLVPGGTLQIRVRAFDPDDDVVTVAWRSPSGRLRQSRGFVSFYAGDLKPGQYAIAGEVSDGMYVARCTVRVEVLKP